MSKRKSTAYTSCQNVSLSSFDAALDLLACETFTRLDQLSTKFEAAAGIKLNEGVVHKRWEDAVGRYWMMKGLDGLSCASKAAVGGYPSDMADQAFRCGCEGYKKFGRCSCKDAKSGSKSRDEVDMDEENQAESSGARPLPAAAYPGAEERHSMNPDEVSELETMAGPKFGDVVLIDLPDKAGLWPGKVS